MQYQIKITPDPDNQRTAGFIDIIGQNGTIFDDRIQTIADNPNIQLEPRSEDFQFEVVDNSDGIQKRLIVFLLNAAEESNKTKIWKNLTVNADLRSGFDFTGSNQIRVIADKTLTFITARNGYVYGRVGDNILPVDTTIGSEFIINNNDTVPWITEIARTGDVFESLILNPGEQRAFQYRPTFYAVATTGGNPDFSEANTEISVLGVASAKISITGTGPYSLTITDVVYA